MSATYVFVPGAGGDAWYWHLVIPEARARGHDVVAVSLQAGDDSAGWTAYADTISTRVTVEATYSVFGDM